MMRDKIVELKEYLALAGWEIKNYDDAFSIVDDKIEWYLTNDTTGSEEIITFYLFDDLGRTTLKLTDILYVMRNKDNYKLYFDKKDNDWKRKVKDFVFTMK